MLKNVIFIFLLALSTRAKGQQIQFGAKAGINFSAITNYQNTTGSTYKSTEYSNFRIGQITELAWQKWILQSGISLDGKGGINTYINPSTSTDRRKSVRLYYLEIPINLLYRMPTKAGSFLLGGGPYFAYGIAGNYSLAGRIFDSPIDGTDKVFFGNNENSDYKRADYGGVLRAELRLLHGIGFELSYEYGLRNITGAGNFDEQGIKTRNQVFGVAVSYVFNKNQSK